MWETFEQKIKEPEDFNKLVFELAAEIKKNTLRRVSNENLHKRIAK